MQHPPPSDALVYAAEHAPRLCRALCRARSASFNSFSRPGEDDGQVIEVTEFQTELKTEVIWVIEVIVFIEFIEALLLMRLLQGWVVRSRERAAQSGASASQSG